jgi:hypothetical protein
VAVKPSFVRFVTLIAGCTVYCDGTSIKGQNHEACFISMNLEGKNVRRFMGVHKLAHHTAQAQFGGFKCNFERFVQLLRKSPLAALFTLDVVDIACKLAGMVTDHAADQKLLVKLFMDWKIRLDREKRGLDAANKLTVEDCMMWAVEALDHAAATTPGWESLESAQRDELFLISWKALLVRAGEEEYKKLSFEEQLELDLFLWHGCMMHKDLNAIHGGDTHMKAAWNTLDLDPAPIPLMNKWEKAASAQGVDMNTRKPPKECHARGGTKLMCLAGAVFNQKDEGKGQQSMIQDWFEMEFGYAHPFPDTSNTQYGSHCDAASKLIVHRYRYIKFMGELFNAKTKVGFTNIEQNIFDALEDWSTLTELAVLALYVQTISKPYVGFVCGYTGNVLLLGPFHLDLKTHIQKLINDPKLATRPECPEEATFLGEPWERADVVYWIHQNINQMPHFYTLFKEFLKGALETWECFTTEFAPRGLIANATPAQLKAAFLLTCNDISESMVGAAKQSILHNPCITDKQRNSKAMQQFNNTADWAKKNLTPAMDQWIRLTARQIDASGLAAKSCAEFAKVFCKKAKSARHKQQQAKQRREAAISKLAATILDQNIDNLMSYTCPQLADMLNKWRETDALVPKCGSLKKAELVQAITKAILREEEAKKEAMAASIELAEAKAEVSRMDEPEPDNEDNVPEDECYDQ